MIERIVQTVLNWPKLTLAMAIGAVVGGVYIASERPVDVFPDINVPRVTIQTEAGGLTAEEVEQRITVPIESAMNGLSGVKTVRSSSGGGLSFVWVDFDWSADPDSARFRVFERLGQVRESLPPEAEPEIAPVISVSGEIMMVALVSDSPEVDSLKLRELAEFDLRNRILAIPGIAQAVTIGGNLPEIRISYDPRLLASYGLGPNDISSALIASRTFASGGYLQNAAGVELPIRQLSRADAVESIRRVLVPNDSGTPLCVGSVAEVSLAGAPRRGSASFNGRDAVVLSVQKAPGGNTLELTRKVEETLDGFTLPAGVRLEREAYRQSDFIGLAIANGRSMVRDAVLIVLLVLGLTLMSWRALLTVLVTMPVSIALGMLFFPSAGLGINIMTLGGFAVAVGDVVDGAIIFTEVFRRRVDDDPLSQISAAAREVGPGVLFSASIIVLVFLPMLFLSGLEGQFFKPLALAFLLVFASSTVVAFLVTPALALMLKLRKSASAGGVSAAERLLQAIYSPILGFSVRFPKTVLVLAVVLVGLALWRVMSFGTGFLPSFREDAMTVFVSMVPGTSLQESERVAENVSIAISRIEGVKSVVRRTGRAERDQHAEPVSASELIVRIDVSVPQDEMRRRINGVIGGIPGVSGMIGYPIAHRISAVLSGSAAELSLNIFGPDAETIRAAAAKVKDLLAASPEVGDVQANREVLVDTLRIDYDLDRMSVEGLTLADAGEQVSAAFCGKVLGTVAIGMNRRDVTMRISGDMDDENAVRSLLLKTGTGRYVRLDDVASVRREEASNLIVHENGRRLALINLNPVPGVSVGELVEKLDGRLQPVLAEFGCSASFGGSYEAGRTAARTLAIMSAALLCVILFILVTATGSVSRALTVIAVLPLALVGAVPAVEYTGGVFTVASAVGLITVVGFVIRNGLLLANRYRELEKGGMEPIESILSGSRERMVPILMTSLTTVFGLVPIILAKDVPGGEILAPLAAVQFGGLVAATFSALVVMPALTRLIIAKQ